MASAVGSKPAGSDVNVYANCPLKVSARRDYLHRLGIVVGKNGRSCLGRMSDDTGPSHYVSPRKLRRSSCGSGRSVFDACSDCDDTGCIVIPCSASSESENATNFRHAYLQKLSCNGVWMPPVARPQKYQTIIMMDWDDTILCTTFANDASPRNKREAHAVMRQLEAAEDAARELLELALSSTCAVYIITNAVCGWVEYSAARYAPSLLPLLQRVRVISARARFEEIFPEDIDQWKIQAFREIRRECRAEVITNLICLGDSEFEFTALRVMAKSFEQVFVKAIKFHPSPTATELAKQLNATVQLFGKFVTDARSFTVNFVPDEEPRITDGFMPYGETVD